MKEQGVVVNYYSKRYSIRSNSNHNAIAVILEGIC